MAPYVKPLSKINGFRPPDTQRLRHAFYRSLPKAMRYTVESLEPRYLLSGTPVPVTDHTKTADTQGSTTQTVNQYDGQQVASELTSIIGKLSYLGQQIDKTSITNPVTDSVIPMLNQTIDQITKGSTGFTLGQFLFSDSSVATSLMSKITSDFTTATATGSTTDLQSSTLASDLQTILQADFGSGFKVTDNSSTATGQLDLSFSYSFTSAAITTPIVLGSAAEQFNLSLVQTTDGGPQANANLYAQTTLSFDVKADFSTTPSDTGSVVNQLGAYQAQTTGNPISQATLKSQLD
ncbi:MAG TPA: LEPR-XLL domain-containing protein, partial [Candidatus Methylacidiphilales bacterium]